MHRNFPAKFSYRLAALLGAALFLGCAGAGASTIEFLSKSDLLVGGGKGLYLVENLGEEPSIRRIWDKGAVYSMASAPGAWFFLTSQGLVYSENLSEFEIRSSGLPKKTLKVYSQGAWGVESSAVSLKDIAIDPDNPSRIAVCTDAEVWMSDTSGETWTSLGSPSAIPGMKALAFGPSETPGRKALWVAHSLRGVYSILPPDPKGWVSRSAGLPRIFGNNMEEISGFAWIPSSGKEPRFAAAATFKSHLAVWNPASKAFETAYSAVGDWGSLESLQAWDKDEGLAIHGNVLAAVEFGAQDSGAARQSAQALAPGARISPLPGATEFFATLGETMRREAQDSPKVLAALPGRLETLFAGTKPLVVEELWRLIPDKSKGEAAQARMAMAAGREGLYLQTGFMIDREKRAFYFDLMARKKLDHVVVDLKDDYGKLRFSPRSGLLQRMGSIGNVLDLEEFTADAKSRGIYLVARVVVFKDEALHGWNKGALAVKDRTTKAPWRGLAQGGQPIGEHWVDPFSEDVWAYNVEIAREAAERGFDEIQFDYIRFPTDGTNLQDAFYPARAPGMSQDDALESFLRYARERIDAPIGVDIYGANGWYRSGTRTGQNVEMLANYVDVVCPMLYPSHFEQEFLAYPPPEQRPYRIYRLGTLRNLAIARNQVLVRPYVQAFYLNVSYDRQFYNQAYVKEEIRGVREGADQGFTYWNNSGRYDDIP